MTPEDILKLHVAVQEIKEFQNSTINIGFNSSLLRADTLQKKAKNYDWPLLSLVAFIVLLIVMVALRHFISIEPKIQDFLTALGFLFSVLAVLCAHLKFDSTPSTLILTIGLLIFVIIGFGIFSPKEAISEAKDIYITTVGKDKK